MRTCTYLLMKMELSANGCYNDLGGGTYRTARTYIIYTQYILSNIYLSIYIYIYYKLYIPSCQ